MSNGNLMSIVDAAGYAMAPADDFVSSPVEFQPEIALRNGHRSAARNLQGRSKTTPLLIQIETLAAWLRDLFGPRWGGRAAA